MVREKQVNSGLQKNPQEGGEAPGRMRISVIGTGYVGLTTAVGMSSLGFEVVGVEKRPEQLESIRSARCPFYEKGMDELLGIVLRQGLFSLTSDISRAVEETDVSFICVGTPQGEGGRIDLGAIREVSGAIGDALRGKGAFHIVVVKSTVLPGTTLDVVGKIIQEKSRKVPGKDFGLAMVPEFLREGSALRDFLEPDRVVIGVEDARTEKALSGLFRKLSAPQLVVNTRTAEMIKYANNAFLALCISFSNEIAQICEKAGQADAYEVMRGVSMDGRITVYRRGEPALVPGIASYLSPGCGFGGSCFPKDLSALANFSSSLGAGGGLVEKTLEINERSKRAAVPAISEMLSGLDGKKIAVLGAAFKPDTDDIRSSPSIEIILGLLAEGAKVRAFDPKALDNLRKIFGSKIEYPKTARDALLGADLAVVVTRWKEFESLTPEDFISLMKTARVFDCRGIYGAREFSKKLEYRRTGLRKGGP